jgi:hypothetical protein
MSWSKSSTTHEFGRSMSWKTLERVLFSLAILATASWSVASISYPMGYDQGMMAAVGDVITRGGLPFRDGFDTKGPLTYYVFALVQGLFGRVMWGIRLIDLGIVITAAALFYSILSRILLSPSISRWMALSLVLATASRSWFHVSQPDGWAAAFVVIAVSLLIGREQVSKIAWLTSGLWISASALIKPFYILFLGVPIAIAAQRGLGTVAMPIILSASGAALPILGMSAWFWLNGALDDLVAVHFGFNLKAYSDVASLSIPGVMESIAMYLWNGGPRSPRGPFGVLLVPILTGVIMTWRERQTVGLGILVWLATAVACVALQGKFFVYHWLIAFPPLLATAGLGLDRLSREAVSGRVFAAIAIGVFVAGVALGPARDTWHYARYVVHLDSRDDYLKGFSRFNYSPLSAVKAAAYIKARTQPTERVAVYGVDAVVQFLSERSSPSRFVYAFPLGVPSRLVRDSYRSEYMSDLRRAAPRYVVLGTHQDESTLSEFPELGKFLAQRYRLDASFGLLELYRLNNGD